MRQYIRKDFFRALAIQLVLVSMFVVVMPLALSAAAPESVNAAPAGDQSAIKGDSLPDPPADQDSIKRILEIVFGIIGAFAVLNITFSGIKYITSAGNEQKTAEAKNGIIYSLVGLMIAISAEAIVAFVITGATKP